ncbi:MAG: TetR/AcrR family transcriptional regulator [Gemmatimonadota bacterium]
MPGTKAPEAERREQILSAAFRVATREGLEGTTMLRIADVAGLSPGLLAFHFKSKRLLLRALLESVLGGAPGRPTIATAVSVGRVTVAKLVEAEIRHACADVWRVRLLVDFWSAGVRDVEFGDRLRVEYRRYRDALRSRIVATQREGRDGADGDWAGVSADGIATVLLSLIHGCALQVAIDPDGFDIDSYIAAVSAAVLSSPIPAST